MVRGERALRERFTFVQYQSDAIVRPAFDEFDPHPFRGLQPIGLQIPREHAHGNIQCDHDIDPFTFNILPAVPALRTRHGQAEK